eukprot:COSAG02_NODE_12547_length_1527_cov_1.703081_1_plen_105_part_10
MDSAQLASSGRSSAVVCKAPLLSLLNAEATSWLHAPSAASLRGCPARRRPSSARAATLMGDATCMPIAMMAARRARGTRARFWRRAKIDSCSSGALSDQETLAHC